MALVGVLLASSLAVPPAAPGIGSGGAAPNTGGAPSTGGTELYGYVPYWAMTASMADYLGSVPLTTIELFSVTARSTGALNTSLTGYKRITGAIGARLIAEAHARGQRVELAFSSFGYERNRALLQLASQPQFDHGWTVAIDRVDEAGPSPRAKRAAEEVVALADLLGVDGVNLDIELVPVDAIDGYAAFIAAVAARLREVRPAAQVSVATMANPSGATLAAVAVASGADRVFLMGYDFHWSGSDPGGVAPIDRTDGGASLTTAIAQYAAAGVPSGRILLGLPLYGRAWPVVASYRDAPRSGNGVAWLPSKHVTMLSSAAFMPYKDITEIVEYVAERSASGWRAVFYDSPRTLAPKLGLALANGYAGAGFWAIGYERGAPGYLELMADFIAGRVVPADLDPSGPPPDPEPCVGRC